MVLQVVCVKQTTSELRCLSGGKRGDYHNCSTFYCVLKLCTVLSTLRWVVLTILWIGFCHTGPTSRCKYLCLFMCVCILCVLFHTAYLHSCIIASTVRWTWWKWNVIYRTVLLQCFDTVSCVVWTVKACPWYDLWYVWWDVKPCSISQIIGKCNMWSVNRLTLLFAMAVQQTEDYGLSLG